VAVTHKITATRRVQARQPLATGYEHRISNITEQVKVAAPALRPCFAYPKNDITENNKLVGFVSFSTTAILLMRLDGSAAPI